MLLLIIEIVNVTEPAFVPGTATILEILADVFLGILVLGNVLKSAVGTAAVSILIISAGIQQLGLRLVLDTSTFLEITRELGNVLTEGVTNTWPGSSALRTLGAPGEIVVTTGGVGAQPVLSLLSEQ